MAQRRLSVKMGLTISLGDFEYLRVDIGLEEDLSPEADLSDAYTEARKWVTDRLRAEKIKITTSPPVPDGGQS